MAKWRCKVLQPDFEKECKLYGRPLLGYEERVEHGGFTDEHYKLRGIVFVKAHNALDAAESTFKHTALDNYSYCVAVGDIVELQPVKHGKNKKRRFFCNHIGWEEV